MKVVAPCFYPTNAPAALLVKSCKAHGLEPILYGVGQQFVAHGADAQVVQLIPILQNLKDKYVMITDCKDSLLLTNETEIMDEFRKRNTQLVMATEKGCWPPNDEVEQAMPQTPLGYDYINAGQYVGEREYIIECLQHLVKEYRGKGGMDNSQPWWPLALIRGELDLKLDNWCRLFQTMSSGEKYSITDEGRLSFAGTTPCSIHFNGSGDLTAYRQLSEELYGKSK